MCHFMWKHTFETKGWKKFIRQDDSFYVKCDSHVTNRHLTVDTQIRINYLNFLHHIIKSMSWTNVLPGRFLYRCWEYSNLMINWNSRLQSISWSYIDGSNVLNCIIKCIVCIYVYKTFVLWKLRDRLNLYSLAFLCVCVYETHDKIKQNVCFCFGSRDIRRDQIKKSIHF